MAFTQRPSGGIANREQILNSDAYSSAGHKLVVEAATALEMPRTAVLSLEMIRRQFAEGQGDRH